MARKAQDELGQLQGLEAVLETLGGPTPYRTGDRVIVRETIRYAELHNGLGHDRQARPRERWRALYDDAAGFFRARRTRYGLQSC